jgi:hypothetical protein
VRVQSRFCVTTEFGEEEVRGDEDEEGSSCRGAEF